MRSFDVKAIDANVDQYWSSMSYAQSVVFGQAASGVSDIMFDRPQENMLPNPTFDANTTSWTGYTYDPTVGHGGLGSAKTTATGTIRDMNSQTFNVNAGETYYVEAWVKWQGVTLNGTGSTIGLGLTANKSDNTKTYPSLEIFLNTNTPTNLDWYKLRGSYTIPAGVTSIIVRPTVRTIVATGDIWFDDIVLYRTDAPDQVSQNRQVCSDGKPGILINKNLGKVTMPDTSDFALSFLIYPDIGDLWLLQWDYPIEAFSEEYQETYSEFAKIGAKLNTDSTISLIWPNATGIIEQKTIYNEEASYLALTRVRDVVSLVINGETLTIENAYEGPINSLTFGGGSGSALIDKIAFSTEGKLPKLSEYFNLFRNTRLDTVPRPNAACSFSYINDISSPKVETLRHANFFFEDGYMYAAVRNQTETGVWSIDTKASFPIEASVDNGATWTFLQPKKVFSEPHDLIIFRHSNDADTDYYIDVVTTDLTVAALASFDRTIDGTLHLPATIGQGYYDADKSSMKEASIEIAVQEAGDEIRTVEFLGEINGPGTWIDTTGATVYVNGEVRPLSSMKANQIYHVVVVYSTPQTSVTINPAKNVDMTISGLGAAEVAYTASEVSFIFKMFAGDTLIQMNQIVKKPGGGTAPNSETNDESSAIEVQWNR